MLCERAHIMYPWPGKLMAVFLLILIPKYSLYFRTDGYTHLFSQVLASRLFCDHSKYQQQQQQQQQQHAHDVPLCPCSRLEARSRNFAAGWGKPLPSRVPGVTRMRHSLRTRGMIWYDTQQQSVWYEYARYTNAEGTEQYYILDAPPFFLPLCRIWPLHSGLHLACGGGRCFVAA